LAIVVNGPTRAAHREDEAPFWGRIGEFPDNKDAVSEVSSASIDITGELIATTQQPNSNHISFLFIITAFLRRLADSAFAARSVSAQSRCENRLPCTPAN